ncbi:hypothetical protein GBA52_020385 [Prunus armeniaca]|nr:hypothetical protein GBA52_020385 [Prunus armeniaca]
MMNLCKLLSSKKPDNTLLITFVATKKWHGFIGSDPKPDNIRHTTLLRARPSKRIFWLVDRLEPPVSTIVADPYVVWAVRVGNGRNIPVAALLPMSATPKLVSAAPAPSTLEQPMSLVSPNLDGSLRSNTLQSWQLTDLK